MEQSQHYSKVIGLTEEFDISISIKPKEHGNRYSQPVLETGYLPIQEAFDQVNDVLRRKFGSDKIIAFQREPRRSRRT